MVYYNHNITNNDWITRMHVDSMPQPTVIAYLGCLTLMGASTVAESIKQIFQRTCINLKSNNATGIANRLVKKGMVVRDINPGSAPGTGRRYSITESGLHELTVVREQLRTTVKFLDLCLEEYERHEEQSINNLINNDTVISINNK